MFRLTTPRKFFKVIYALDTRYSVLEKEKPFRVLAWATTNTPKGYTDIVCNCADTALPHYIRFLPIIISHKIALVNTFYQISIKKENSTRQSEVS